MWSFPPSQTLPLLVSHRCGVHLASTKSNRVGDNDGHSPGNRRQVQLDHSNGPLCGSAGGGGGGSDGRTVVSCLFVCVF